MKIGSITEYGNFAFTGKSYLNRVFGWMGLGLALTSLISYLVYFTPEIVELFIAKNAVTGLGFLFLFLPLGFLLLTFKKINGFSYVSLIFIFLLYSAIMGISQSVLFLAYSNQSIHCTFNAVALMFSALGLIGYVTKSSSVKTANFSRMVISGIIIAVLLNVFVKNDSLSMVISFVCVVSFGAVTVWNIKDMENLAEEATSTPELNSKLGILGALMLYLNFINVFLFARKIFRI